MVYNPNEEWWEIKTNPIKKLNTIGIANIADIIPKSVSPATSHRGIAIKDKRIPIPIRIIPTIFRIFFGIKSRINSNNKSPILHALYSEENPIRFTELKNRVDTSSTTLTRRLGELEDHRLVKRTVYETVPATVVYQLTDSGADLLPSLESFFEWVINDTNQTQWMHF